jgi:hypothetical protein
LTNCVKIQAAMNNQSKHGQGCSTSSYVVTPDTPRTLPDMTPPDVSASPQPPAPPAPPSPSETPPRECRGCGFKGPGTHDCGEIVARCVIPTCLSHLDARHNIPDMLMVRDAHRAARQASVRFENARILQIYLDHEEEARLTQNANRAMEGSGAGGADRSQEVQEEEDKPSFGDDDGWATRQLLRPDASPLAKRRKLKVKSAKRSIPVTDKAMREKADLEAAAMRDFEKAPSCGGSDHDLDEATAHHRATRKASKAKRDKAKLAHREARNKLEWNRHSKLKMENTYQREEIQQLKKKNAAYVNCDEGNTADNKAMCMHLGRLEAELMRLTAQRTTEALEHRAQIDAGSMFLQSFMCCCETMIDEIVLCAARVALSMSEAALEAIKTQEAARLGRNLTTARLNDAIRMNVVMTNIAMNRMKDDATAANCTMYGHCLNTYATMINLASAETTKDRNENDEMLNQIIKASQRVVETANNALNVCKNAIQITEDNEERHDDDDDGNDTDTTEVVLQ